MPKILPKIELLSLCFLFLSIFISKAGIYVGLSLLLLIQIYNFTLDKNFRYFITREQLLFGCMALFLLGIISTLSFNAEDSLTYFRKASILLVFPVLYFQLLNGSRLRWAQVSLVIGLVVGLGNAFYALSLTPEWNGQRITSFWDVGRWAECLGYSLAIITPLIFENRSSSNQIKRISYIFLSITCVIALVLSGGRGPLLAVMITGALYLTLRSPKILLTILISVFAIFYVGKSFQPIDTVYHRIVSIADTQHNDSNNARLIMWQNGLNFTKYNLTHNPREFFFGVGIKQFEEKYTKFLESSADIQAIVEQTNGEVSFKDLHNTYLDLSVKIGFIYALAYIILLIATLRVFLRHRNTGGAWAYSGICLVSTYLITSMFYTSGLEYQTTIFFTLVALCYARVSLELKHNE